MAAKPAPPLRRFRQGDITGVVVREIRKFSDERGWLAEIFRNDELTEDMRPMMAYLSSTEPGATRGPHAHKNQADLFFFGGPSDFKLRLWDERKGSETFGTMATFIAGETNPLFVLIPSGVVHAYRNIGNVAGFTLNCPNRLYKGEGRAAEVDELRYEDDPASPYLMDD